MALKVLIADPSQEWLQHAKQYFKEKNYEIDTATNGRDAQLAIFNVLDQKEEYFSIILNLSIQDHSGPQVMKFIKSRTHQQNVIALIENQEWLDRGDVTPEQIARLGAQEYLVKPLEFDNLLGALEGGASLDQLVGQLPKNQGTGDEEETSMDDESFSKIAVDDFYPNKRVLFDIFVRLQTNKYIKILHAGDTFSKERIDKYKIKKNVKFFYFHNRDRKKYIRFCNHLAAKFIDNGMKGATKMKVGILKTAAEQFIDDIHTEGLKPTSIEQGKEVCNTIYDMIEGDKDLYKLMKDINQFDPTAYSHAYLVSLFAAMIVMEFEWQSKAIVETVAIASLFHDIGKTKLPKEILGRPVDELSEEELLQYKEHPKIGAEIVEGNKMITNSIKQIILQHHEYSDGSGFPNGLKDPKLTTLSKVVILANYFADYTFENEVSPVQALKTVLTNPDIVKKFNGSILEHFLKVFVDPDKKKKGPTLQSNSKVVKKSA